MLFLTREGLEWTAEIPNPLEAAVALMACILEPTCTCYSRVGAHRPYLGLEKWNLKSMSQTRPQRSCFGFFCPILFGAPTPTSSTVHDCPQHILCSLAICCCLSPRHPCCHLCMLPAVSRVPRSGGGGLRSTCASVSQGSWEYEIVTPPVCLRLAVR